MAGEDFLPVGIKAVVVGVDTFLADLRRMQAGVTKFGDTVKETGLDLQTFSDSAQASSAGSKAFAQQARALADGSSQAALSLSRLAKAMRGFSATTTAANPRIAETASSLTRLRGTFGQTGNAATAFFNKLAAGSQKIATSSNLYTGQVQKLAQLQARYNQIKTVLTTVENKYKTSTNAVKRLGDEQEQASRELQRTSNSAAITRRKLLELSKSYAALRSNTKASSGTLSSYAATLASLSSKYREQVVSIAGLNARIIQLGNSQRHAQTTASGLLASQAQLAAVLASVGAAASGQQLTVLALNVAIKGLSTAFKGLGVAAAGAVAGFGILKGVFSGIIGSIRGVNNAFIRVATSIKRLNATMAKLATRAFRVGNSIRFLGTSLTFLVSFPIIGFFKKMTDAAIDFEDAFAGIIRTVDDPSLGVFFTLIEKGSNDIRDLTTVGENLQRGIRNLALELPVPVNELARLGEVAGTLGIRGNQNLLTFIETTARLGATTNIASEDAATGLGKLLGVAGGLTDLELDLAGFTQGQIDAMSVSERFQISAVSLGGVLVDLGNKTRAQEDEILNFTRKIQGVGAAMGLTAAEMLGFSAAFVAVAVDAARGGTAFQKVMVAMLTAVQEGGEELEIFAATSGETIEDFVKLFRDDASEALRKFIEGIGQAGEDGVAVLQALELADARVLASIFSLASGSGELTRELQLVNDELERQGRGLEEFNALMIESERRFSTTKNQVQLLKNQFTEMGIDLGTILLPPLLKTITFVRGLVKSFIALSKPVKTFILTVAGFVAIVGPIVTGVGLILATFGFFVAVIFKAIGVVLALASTLGVLIFPLVAVAAAAIGLAIAFAASFNKIGSLATITTETLVTKMWEFGRNIIIAFAKGMAAAIIAVVQVLNAIGKVIAKWLKPGSPPKLLPDLDKWGAGAMQAYMDGWLDADFGVFNKLADKIERFLRSINDAADDAGRKNLIEQIIGTRSVIAKAVNEIKKFGKVTVATMKKISKAMGSASAQMRRFIKAQIDVAIAAEKVKRAQEEVNRIMREYEQALKPIDKRLAQINKRQEEVADAMRIAELEQILADPRASELVRELAQLEIEQIGLEQDASGLEEVKNAALETAEAQLEAAELRLEAADEELAAAEAMLDVIIKNNELLQEMKETAKDTASSLKDVAGALGDLDLGFDESELDELLAQLEQDGAMLDLEFDVDSIADSISGSFDLLIADIKAQFAPLIGENGLFAELGETWAPIFEKLGTFLDENTPRFNLLSSNIEDIAEKTQGWADTVQKFLDGSLGELFRLLVDLGLIKPFGPLVEEAEGSDGPLSKLAKKFAEVKEAIGELPQKIRDLVANIIEFFSESSIGRAILTTLFVWFVQLKAVWESLSPVVENLKNTFENLKRPLAQIFENVEILWESTAGMRNALGSLLQVLAIVVGFIGAVVVGVLVGLVRALAQGLEYFSFFFGILVDGLAQAVGAIIQVIGGIFDFIGSFINWLVTGNSEKLEEMKEAWTRIWTGILDLVVGIGTAIFGAIVGVFATIIGLFQGFVEGIIDFFTSLYNTLVGNSIIPDMVNDIIEWFTTMVTDVIEGISGFVADAIQWFLDLANGIIEKVQIGIDFLLGLPATLLTAGKDAIQGFIDGITSIDVGEKISEIGGNILGGIKGALGISSPSKEFEEVGEQSMDGWIEGVENKLRDIEKLYTATSAKILEIVVEMYKALIQVERQSAPIIVELNEDMLTEIIDSTEVFGKLFSLGRSSLWAMILEAALDWWVLFKESLGEVELPDILELIFEFMESLNKLFIEQIDNWRALGLALMAGLNSGLANGAGAVYATAQAIANEVRRIIEEAMQVDSPSKVFMGIGENMMEGWKIGLEAGQSELYGTLVNIAEGAQTASVQASPQRAPNRLAPVSSASSVVNAEVNMGGQQINNGMDTVMLQIALEQALRNVLQ